MITRDEMDVLANLGHEALEGLVDEVIRLRREVSDHDIMYDECDRLRAEVARLHHEAEHWREARQRAMLAADTVREERDSLIVERDRLKTELEALEVELGAADKFYAVTLRQRDAAWREGDELRDVLSYIVEFVLKPLADLNVDTIGSIPADECFLWKRQSNFREEKGLHVGHVLAAREALKRLI